ncbi:MAG: LacI family DNA-binding transcriptional regulator [Candidatus Hydrogenedentota bacterium]
MGESLTIRTIAEAAGVSPSAVSKALNSRPGISPAMRLRVQQIAQNLGYAPYVASRRKGMLSPGGCHVAVLFGPVGPHIVREVQFGIDVALRSSGFYELRCSLMPEDPDREEVKRGFLRKVEEDPAIAGLLACCVSIEDSVATSLGRRRIPIVHLDGDRSIKRGHVMIDHVDASNQAATALLKLGRRKVGYIGPRAEIAWVWRERYRGVEETVRRAKAVFEFEEESICDMVQAAFATRRLMERAPQTDALIYSSDLQALGGMRMLREMGIDVPGRVAVIGFDDSDVCRAVSPMVSSVRQPFRRMGETGTRMLLRAIEGKSGALKKTELRAKLVMRSSCLGDSPGDRWHRDMSREVMVRTA